MKKRVGALIVAFLACSTFGSDLSSLTRYSAATPGSIQPEFNVDIKPIDHRVAHPPWQQWKVGLVEFAAMALELYRESHLFAAGRDARFLLYALILASEGDPSALQRLHELPVSTFTLGHPELKRFAWQRGITDEFFKEGNQAVILDICCSGNAVRFLRRLFPSQYRGQITGSYVVATTAENPATRVFLTAMDSEAPRKSPSDFVGVINRDWEYGMPLLTNSAVGYEWQDGELKTVYGDDSFQWNGRVSPRHHLMLMEDLAAHFRKPEVVLHLRQRRETWRLLKAFADDRRSDDLARSLKAILEQAPEDPMAESMVRDFIDRYQNRVCLDDVGLPFVRGSGASEENAKYLKYRFPEWRSIIKYPESEVPKWIEAKRFRDLKLLAHAISDFEIKRVLLEVLSRDQAPLEAREVIKIILNRTDDSHAQISDYWREKSQSCATRLIKGE